MQDVLADVVGSEGRLTAGVLLMLLHAGVVIALGVVAYPVLKRHHPVTASAYLLTRGFEAALLAGGSVLILSLLPLAHELEPDRLGEQGQLDWSRASLDLVSVRAKRGVS